MTELIVAYGVLAVLFLLYIVRSDRACERREQAWAEERRELLTRIQHPHIVQLPASRQQPVTTPPPEDDEYDLVGTVADDPGPEDGS